MLCSHSLSLVVVVVASSPWLRSCGTPAPAPVLVSSSLFFVPLVVVVVVEWWRRRRRWWRQWLRRWYDKRRLFFFFVCCCYGGSCNREEGNDGKKEGRTKYNTIQYDTNMTIMMTITNTYVDVDSYWIDYTACYCYCCCCRYCCCYCIQVDAVTDVATAACGVLRMSIVVVVVVRQKSYPYRRWLFDGIDWTVRMLLFWACIVRVNTMRWRPNKEKHDPRCDDDDDDDDAVPILFVASYTRLIRWMSIGASGTSTFAITTTTTPQPHQKPQPRPWY